MKSIGVEHCTKDGKFLKWNNGNKENIWKWKNCEEMKISGVEQERK